MSSARPAWLVAGLIAALSGCAQSGSILSQRSTVGSLKTGLSHLEYENQQLKKEVAVLKDDNRQIENRLVQEESANGDLAARLDDARTLLTQRGLGGDAGSSALDLGPVRKTLPAGQSNKKRRRAPFAQIPGRIDVLPPTDDDPSTPGWSKSPTPGFIEPGSTSGLDRPTIWLPVARGATESPRSRR